MAVGILIKIKSTVVEMGPKKGGAAAAGEEDDVTTDKFWKDYKKNCQQLDLTPNAEIKRMNELYLEER